MRMAFQGALGSYSDLALRDGFPNEETLPILYFEKIDCVATPVFRAGNRNSTIFNALLGLVTNGINITKLESSMLDGKFTATQYLYKVESHLDLPGMVAALNDLWHHTKHVQILGVYPRDSYSSAL